MQSLWLYKQYTNLKLLSSASVFLATLAPHSAFGQSTQAAIRGGQYANRSLQATDCNIFDQDAQRMCKILHALGKSTSENTALGLQTQLSEVIEELIIQDCQDNVQAIFDVADVLEITVDDILFEAGLDGSVLPSDVPSLTPSQSPSLSLEVCVLC